MTEVPAIVVDEPSTALVPSRWAAPDRADRDPYSVYLGRLTGESRRAMAGCLDRLARLAVGAALDDSDVTGLGFPWQDLRYSHTAVLRRLVAEQPWAPAYANKHLVALRMTLREAWRLDLMSAEDLARASDLHAVPGTRLPAGRMLAPEEAAALLDACVESGTAKGVRDAALLAVAYSSGVRRAELVGLTVGAWTPADRSIRVIGKGGKQRQVFLAPWAARYLQAWLRLRGRRLNNSEPLFTRVFKSGKIGINPLSGQTVADILGARARQAGTPDASPHDIRRTFISTLLGDPETDLVSVQQLAGHASPATTSRYDRRDEQARSAAVSRLPDPHRSRRH